MPIIDRLSPAQQKTMRDEIDSWLKISQSTEPLNRAAATATLGALYQAIGKARPRVLFFSSPAMCVLALDALHSFAAATENRPPEPALSNFPTQLDNRLRETFEANWRDLPAQFGSQATEDRRIWDEIRRQFGDPNDPANGVWDDLLDQYSDLLRGLKDGPVQAQLTGQVRGQVADQFEDLLGSQLERQWRIPHSQLQDQFDTYLSWSCFVGNWSSYLHPLYDFLNHLGVTYSSAQIALLQLWIKQSQHCHWWFPCSGIVVASDRPRVLTLDSEGRLHNDSRPALEYEDGYCVYANHGVRVEPRAAGSE